MSGDEQARRSGKIVVIVFVLLTAAFAAIVAYGMRALRVPQGGLPAPPAASSR